ncbi:MAG: hypothetical protein HYV75_08345, partial [Opitutae bacterium]|nr:hypothetical protein [Opitutae bacterium]
HALQLLFMIGKAGRQEPAQAEGVALSRRKGRTLVEKRIVQKVDAAFALQVKLAFHDDRY